MVQKKVVQPMEPIWLIKYFSESMLEERTLKCITAAFKKYHQAIHDAGEMLEEDLIKCKDLPVGGKKPPSKK